MCLLCPLFCSSTSVASLLSVVTNVVNVVGASSKRRDILHDKQFVVVSESLKHGEISSGQGLNQETTLKCACDTRWGFTLWYFTHID